MRATLIAPQLVLNIGPRRPSWTLRARARLLAGRFDSAWPRGCGCFLTGPAPAIH